MANHLTNDIQTHRINVRYSAGRNKRINNDVKNALKHLSNTSPEYAENALVNDSAYLYDTNK